MNMEMFQSISHGKPCKDGFILEISNTSVKALPSMKKQFETFKMLNKL